MSLLQRVERAQQGANGENVVAVVPVAPPPPTPSSTAGRDDMLRNVRLRLQAEVISSFDSLLEGPDTAIKVK